MFYNLTTSMTGNSLMLLITQDSSTRKVIYKTQPWAIYYIK